MYRKNIKMFWTFEQWNELVGRPSFALNSFKCACFLLIRSYKKLALFLNSSIRKTYSINWLAEIVPIKPSFVAQVFTVLKRNFQRRFLRWRSQFLQSWFACSLQIKCRMLPQNLVTVIEMKYGRVSMIRCAIMHFFF